MKQYSRFLWPLMAFAAVFSCAKTQEEDIVEVPLTTIEAYILPEDEEVTKTNYAIAGGNATFTWVEEDHIDVAVSKGGNISSVVFTLTDLENTRFQDGQVSGESTLSQLVGYTLSDWAFYPSRVSPEAQEGNFAPDWSYAGGNYTIDLPSSVTPPVSKPMSVVPLVGKKDGEGKYGFTQLMGVLAVPVTGLSGDEDFITLKSEGAALSGSFVIDASGALPEVKISGNTYKDPDGVTLHFSGLSGDQTFYFALPTGAIPAGMTLTIGNSADSDTWMTKTTKKAITIKRGVLSMSPALAYVPKDLLWADYIEGTFLDDFLWAQHGWSTSTTIPVTIQRSGLHSNKYRIANPYTAACTQFEYTPYTEGVTADDYLVFSVDEETGKVFFYTFKTGIEDKNSGGKPMMITHPTVWSSSRKGTYNVATFTRGGDVATVQLAAMYSQYENPSGYNYTRDGEGTTHADRIHIVFNQPATWDKVLDGEFIDTKIWGLQNWGSTRVPIELYQNSGNTNSFRVPNPYLIAKEQFGYSTYTEGITGDEYLEFTIGEENAVRFVTYLAGIEDKASGGHAMKVWYPLDWGSGETEKAGYNKVISYRSDDLPAEIQLHPFFSDVNPSNYSYKYTDQRSALTYLYFPEAEETWTSLGTGRFRDEEMWYRNAFAPYDVEVEISRSSLNANRYRVNNPYTVGNTAFKRTAADAGGDDYLYFVIDPSNKQVTFGSLVTGMTWNQNGSPEQNKSSVTCNWVIADKADTKSVLNKDISASTVIEGTATAPEKLQLIASYYANGDETYFYTNSLKNKYLWFPGAYLSGETWTDYCEGTYVDGTYDGNINGSDAIGTVAVTIQQSSVDAKRFRVANPYRANVATEYLCSSGIYDDYMYFKCGDANDLVFMEPFRPGVKMDPSSHPSYELAMQHPVSSNLRGWSQGGSDFAYSNVVTKLSDGSPAKVRLGVHYFDITGPTPGYCYTRQGSGRLDSERIFITFNVTDKAIVTPKQFPMKVAFDNPVEVLSLPSGTLEKVVVKITGVDLSKVEGLRLYQKDHWMNDEYVAPDGGGIVTIDSFSNATVSGDIDLNCKLSSVNLGDVIRFQIQEVVVDGVSLPVKQDLSLAHYPGLILNHASDVINARGQGDETVASFRIPALVTANDGTLVGAYDVRYDSSTDLQNDIDVGVKLSHDGGQTWSEIVLAMDMGTWGYEDEIAGGTKTWKQAQQLNGIGDPCLLVDENTGDIFCFGLWTHGKSNGTRALGFGGTGYDPDDVPQLVMVKSSDNGATWSEPVNLTRQLKKYDWGLIFQGPGRGITMKDGTLVIPVQHQEFGHLNSGIAYSKDHGLTWHTHALARQTTSEAAVAEIEPGVLMLTMRDETNSRRRAVYTTSDLGRSWTAHVTDGEVPEPTCEASLLHVDASANSLNQDLLLFSNPNNGANTGRNHITIKASLDQGTTWTYATLLDQGGSMGYSCLTMVDDSTVGILYESSQGNILFQAIPLSEIVK